MKLQSTRARTLSLSSAVTGCYHVLKMTEVFLREGAIVPKDDLNLCFWSFGIVFEGCVCLSLD